MKDVDNRPKHMTRDEYIAQQMTLLRHVHHEHADQRSKQCKTAQWDNAMSEATASSVQKRPANHASVKEIICTTQANGPDGVMQTKTVRRKPVTPIYAQAPNEREVRGVKGSLKKAKRDMKYTDFHNHHGHNVMGTSPWCKLCRMVKGAMRRIYKVLDPYKPRVPGYAWVMDMNVVE